jgi:hypothetical protein
VLQVNPHVVPSQVAAPFVGVAHGVHEVPHEFALLLGWQVPLQSWVPIGQTPAHGCPDGMHTPAHSFISDGQVPPHCVPSQVAVPPVGTEHAVQLDPQDLTAVLLAQAEPHTW